MKYFIFAILIGFNTNVLANSGCTISVSSYHTNSNLVRYAKKFLTKKGFEVVNQTAETTYNLSINDVEIDSEGRSVIAEIFNAYEPVYVSIGKLPSYDVQYENEARVHGFIPIMLAKKALATRRMLRNLPSCMNGVLSKTGSENPEE